MPEPIVTSHDLARRLLALPDCPLTVTWGGNERPCVIRPHGTGMIPTRIELRPLLDKPRPT